MNNSLLLILPKLKLIPFSIISSSGSKVESNFDFHRNNPTMQFVYSNGLPIYLAYVVDFSNIYVITEEEESELSPPKKLKRIMTYHESVKMCGLLNFHGQRC